MFKKLITTQVAKYIYPQTVFAQSINNQITSTNQGVLLDVPCGNGETTWHLAQHSLNLTVHGYDLDAASIARATTNFNATNLSYEVSAAQAALAQHNQVYYTCIINSIFLLPQPEQLLSTAYSKLITGGKLFVIIPNTVGRNYQYFEQSGQAHINSLVIHHTEITNWFATIGLTVSNITPIAYTHHYNRTDTKFMSVLGHYYLNMLNKIQTALKIGTPNYFLITIHKA